MSEIWTIIVWLMAGCVLGVVTVPLAVMAKSAGRKRG